jgi:hypothetical protein
MKIRLKKKTLLKRHQTKIRPQHLHRLQKLSQLYLEAHLNLNLALQNSIKLQLHPHRQSLMTLAHKNQKALKDLKSLGHKKEDPLDPINPQQSMILSFRVSIDLMRL